MSAERYDAREDEFLADQHDWERELAFEDLECRDRLSGHAPAGAQWFTASSEVPGPSKARAHAASDEPLSPAAADIGPGSTARAATSMASPARDGGRGEVTAGSGSLSEEVVPGSESCSDAQHAVDAAPTAFSPPSPTPGGSSRTSHVARPGAEANDSKEVA